MELLTVYGPVAAATLVLQQVGEWLIGSDAVRLGIVYVHLMACCVAIGVVFTSDIAFVAQLLKGNPYARQDPEHLRALQSTVTLALSALWLTGMAIVVLDASASGWSYYLNPKLQAKVVIVCLLTLNGLLLHNAVLPAIVKAGNLLHLSVSRRLLAVFAGSVSGVSWGYAAMLGIARPLNWRYSLEELLAMYPMFIAAGFLAMLLLTFWARYRGGRAQPRVRVEPSGNRGFTRA